MKNIDFQNKTVIIRTDYNVPIQNGNITSTLRIDSSLQTINHILKGNPEKLIIISHLGRPKNNESELSLLPVKKYLEKVLEKNVGFSTFNDYLSRSQASNSENIVLLENIRYYPEETKEIETTLEFRRKLTSLGDVFINDAFGCSHRAHSSIVGVNCPERCCGFLVEKEKRFLLDIFHGNDGDKKEQEFKNENATTLILGGSKIHDKIQLINNLIPKVDYILIGGGMAFTFLKYFNNEIGNSLFDEEGFRLIPKIIQNAKKYNTHLIYPTDFICNDKFANGGNITHKDLTTGIPEGFMGLDIGTKTVDNFKTYIEKSSKIIWNGPLGVFELDDYAEGSRQIMDALSKSSATTVIGGGDTASCCDKFGLSHKMSHVSTGGGAALELLEGKTLPGLFL